MSTATIAESDTERLSAQRQTRMEGKYLTFVLGVEEYGVDIMAVREINGIMNITSLPNMPDFIKGVINLRGSVIPVIDLRLKFGMKSVEYNKETCVIVVDVGEVTMGVIVDTVSEVLDIVKEDIEPAPSFGDYVDTRYILGMGKVKDGIKILLDIGKVVTDKELMKMKQAAKAIA